jgi:YidC/Oxa1 family membrane protein insertase
MGWLQQLHANVGLFDETLLGVVDLSRSALSNGSIYWPALLIVTGSAIIQFYQSKQLTPDDKDARSLRQILSEAKGGKQADQSEVSTAMARNTRYILPVLIFVFTIGLPSALSLYWLIGGLVAFIQQSIILREDVTEMEEIGDEKTAKKKPGAKSKAAADKEKNAIEAEIVKTPAAKPNTKSKQAARKKRRKK